MDCDDAAFLLAADAQRTLATGEDQGLRDHLRDCRDCEQLASELAASGFRWVARIPEDALDDRDLLVLPTVDPSVFEGGPELAHGGMGRILRARDRRLGREVAIKEVLSPAMRARFEREVAITARLQHPAIVPIYEAGAWPNGTTFYAMRLVSGGTLQDAIARTRTLEERLELLPKVIAVVDALAYAHERRIVHRDLKPGNVLVGEHGETVVIDWGLAKDLGRPEPANTPAPGAAATAAITRAGPGDISHDATLAASSSSSGAAASGSSALTVAGAVMGTPCYMAPEQARGAEVDERADVYALGAILYTVLAGTAPYLASGDVSTPTQLVALAVEQPPTPIAELAPRAPLDLRVIVERAMARDPAARYASAKEMADELRRFESGQLLRSREYGARELLARWVRRHRAAVLVSSIAAAIVAVVGISAIVGMARSRASEREARAAAESARDQAEGNVAALLEEQGRDQLLAGDNPRALAYLAEAYHRGRDTTALRHMLAVASRDLELLDHATSPAGHELAAIAFTSDGQLVTIDTGPAARISIFRGEDRAASHPLAGDITGARLDAGGRRAAVELRGGDLAVHDVASGARLWGSSELHAKLEAIQLDPRGERLLAIAGDRSDLELRDAGTGARLAALGAPGVAAFSDDGARAAACSDGGDCKLWDAATGRVLGTDRVLHRGPTTLAFLGNDRIVVGTAERTAELHELRGEGIELRGHYAEVVAVATTPYGEQIATGDATGAVRLWTGAGSLVGELRDHRGELDTLAFSPDGTQLLGGGTDRRVYVWDMRSLERVAAIEAFHGTTTSIHTGTATNRAASHGLVWAPGGARFATLGLDDDRAYVWRPPGGHRVGALSGATAAAGALLVEVVDTDVATLGFSALDPRGRLAVGAPAAASAPPRTDRVAVSRDGRRALVWHPEERRAFTCDLAAGRPLAELSLVTPPGRLSSLAASDDGRYILELPRYASDAPPLRVHDATTGRVVREFQLAYVASAALSPDGDRVAVAFAGVDRPALWRVSTGERLALPELPTDLSAVSFDPTGRRLAVFAGTRTVVIDTSSGRIASELVRPDRAGAVRHPDDEVRWDDTGRRLATRSSDRIVWLWDADTGALLGSVEDVPEGGFALSADGARLATATFDSAIRIWDVATTRLLEVIREDGRGGIAWSADGARLLAQPGDGHVSTVWDVHLEQRTPAQIDDLAARATRWKIVGGLLVERR